MPTSPRPLRLHVATGSCVLEEANRIARLAVGLFETRSGAASSSRPRRGGARRAQEGLRRSPDAVGEFDVPTCCSASPDLGDEQLERVRRRLPPPIGAFPCTFRFGHHCARSTCISRRRRRLPSHVRESAVARAALATFEPNAVVAVGPAEACPFEGKDFVDGKPAVYVCERFACRKR